MLYLTTSLAALITYLCSTGYMLTLLRKRRPLHKQWLCALQGVAIALHGVGLYHIMVFPSGVDLTITKAFSLVMLSINIILLISGMRKPLHNLFIILSPLTAFAIALSYLSLQTTPTPMTQMTFGIGAHVILSLIAYSLLSISSLQALLLHWQNSRLKKRQLTGLIKHLPPLQTMESLMFDLVWAGVILLTGGIMFGALYVNDMFAQHLAHKTILSIIAWGTFSTLLWGRVIKGWRANKAIHWVLVGFCTLMLAYFGSKVALEVVL